MEGKKLLDHYTFGVAPALTKNQYEIYQEIEKNKIESEKMNGKITELKIELKSMENYKYRIKSRIHDTKFYINLLKIRNKKEDEMEEILQQNLKMQNELLFLLIDNSSKFDKTDLITSRNKYLFEELSKFSEFYEKRQIELENSNKYREYQSLKSDIQAVEDELNDLKIFQGNMQSEYKEKICELDNAIADNKRELLEIEQIKKKIDEEKATNKLTNEIRRLQEDHKAKEEKEKFLKEKLQILQEQISKKSEIKQLFTCFTPAQLSLDDLLNDEIDEKKLDKGAQIFLSDLRRSSSEEENPYFKDSKKNQSENVKNNEEIIREMENSQITLIHDDKEKFMKNEKNEMIDENHKKSKSIPKIQIIENIKIKSSTRIDDNSQNIKEFENNSPLKINFTKNVKSKEIISQHIDKKINYQKIMKKKSKKQRNQIALSNVNSSSGKTKMKIDKENSNEGEIVTIDKSNNGKSLNEKENDENVVKATNETTETSNSQKYDLKKLNSPKTFMKEFSIFTKSKENKTTTIDNDELGNVFEMGFDDNNQSKSDDNDDKSGEDINFDMNVVDFQFDNEGQSEEKFDFSDQMNTLFDTDTEGNLFTL